MDTMKRRCRGGRKEGRRLGYKGWSRIEGNNGWPLSKGSRTKMQSKAGINTEPWGTPLVLINTPNCLPELRYLLHRTVHAIVIPVGDRNTTNLPPRWQLHLSTPETSEGSFFYYYFHHGVIMELLLEPAFKELLRAHKRDFLSLLLLRHLNKLLSPTFICYMWVTRFDLKNR